MVKRSLRPWKIPPRGNSNFRKNQHLVKNAGKIIKSRYLKTGIAKIIVKILYFK